MANLPMTAGRLDSGSVWDLEDEEALAAARTLIGQYSDIESADAEPSDAPEPRSRRLPMDDPMLAAR